MNRQAVQQLASYPPGPLLSLQCRWRRFRGLGSYWADRNYDTAGLVASCRANRVTPHVTQNDGCGGGSAIDGAQGTRGRLRHQPVQAQMHRAGLRLEQDGRPDSSGDVSWSRAGRAVVPRRPNPRGTYILRGRNRPKKRPAHRITRTAVVPFKIAVDGTPSRPPATGRSVRLLMVVPICFTQVRPVSDLKQRRMLPRRIRT